jgi:hypothetical protein
VEADNFARDDEKKDLDMFDEDMAEGKVKDGELDEDLDRRYLGNVEEALDRRAELLQPDGATWDIEHATNDRLVYVPKDTVMDFMKQVEMESNRRIDRYKGYAAGLKHKFAEFERQSEEYYGALLEKFKGRATKEIERKQKYLSELELQRQGHIDKINDIRRKLIERKVKDAKGIMSDDDMESDPEEPELSVHDTKG